MEGLYDRIELLCNSRGINITQMCKESGVPRSTLSDFKANRIKSISTDKLAKIADFFEVSVDYLLGKENQKENAPAKAEAYVNGDSELNEYLEELKNREECRMLFSLAKGATKEDVMRAVAIIEALRREEEGR